MSKIFRYELKRLVLNKFFIGILAVLLFYGWQILSGKTLLGVAHTAPFSPWSFGDYLSRMVPLLWVGALFFLTFFTSASEKRTAVLTSATPVKPSSYALARYAAALVSTLLLTIAVLALAGFFYGKYFGWYSWGGFILPTLITLLPVLLFALGSGWLLGNLRPWLVYVWMLVPFLLGALPLPQALSIWNGSFFTSYPLKLGILDPSFSLPTGVLCVQIVTLLLGVVLMLGNRFIIAFFDSSN